MPSRPGGSPATSNYVSAPFLYQPSPKVLPWNVSTYDHGYHGRTSIEQATLRSDNTGYAQLTIDQGPSNAAATARRLGIQSPLPPVPSLGPGTIGVSLLGMASAHATLSAGGIYSRPMAITNVVLANGKADRTSGWGRPARKRVISEGVAYVVTKILEENVQYGTGTAANFGLRRRAGRARKPFERGKYALSYVPSYLLPPPPPLPADTGPPSSGPPGGNH